MNKQNIITKPLITEHSVKEASKGRFTFVVDKASSKDDIKAAVEKLFKVNVVKVFTSRVKGTKTRNTKAGKTTTDESYKKARVKLAGDQKIDIFEISANK